MSIHLHTQLSLFAGARMHTSRSGTTTMSGASLGSRTNASAPPKPTFAAQVKQLYWPDQREQTVQLVDPYSEQSSFRLELGVAL